MKDLLRDDRAESPIQVGFVVMLSIMTLALAMIVLGTFADKFMAVMEAIRASMPLTSAWGESMWALLPVQYSVWLWAVPGFFIMLVMAWGIKTVFSRSKYTKQDTQYFADEEF